jgi:hypothetical protein
MSVLPYKTTLISPIESLLPVFMIDFPLIVMKLIDEFGFPLVKSIGTSTVPEDRLLNITCLSESAGSSTVVYRL